ncbi:hypothetical protein GCM10007922_16190 [Shewanella decolorationis]|nr:hypothetical protein GCM10007922_16190 [Shewanella decolorationis]
MVEWLTAQLATINLVADLQQARAWLATMPTSTPRAESQARQIQVTLNLLKSRKSRCLGNQEL